MECPSRHGLPEWGLALLIAALFLLSLGAAVYFYLAGDGAGSAPTPTPAPPAATPITDAAGEVLLLEAYVLDVQGDCFFARAADGSTLLVDAGCGADAEAIDAFLQAHSVARLDAVFVSRPVESRLGGMAAGLLTLGRGLDRWMPLLAGLLAAALASLAALSLSEGLRQRLLALWIRRDRGLAAETATARIAQALAMGLASGLPMEEALDLAARLQGENRKAAERCRKCREQIETGAGLTESLREAGVLPADCCRLLAAGVRAGAADTVMDRLARRLAENSENHLSAAVARVEPLLVLVSALLVGGVILSVMLPLMDILSALG